MKNGIQAQLWNGKKFQPGWLSWKAGRIEALSFQAPSRKQQSALENLGCCRILPGFVDTLLHGYAGVDCSTGSARDLERMTSALAASGVTTALAGFYPLTDSQFSAAARRWEKWKGTRGGVRTRIHGWHVEGPFIEPTMRGALARKDLRKAGFSAAQQLLKVCAGWLHLCTLAPELPGALDVAEALRASKVLVSIGHSRARYVDCEAVAANGPCAITHLGNRIPAFSARQPGPIAFAMEGGADWVGVIPDMVHIAPETLRLWAHTPALKKCLMATSDNLSHAGLAAESFSAGGKKLKRSGAVAIDSAGNLAGTLDALPELLLRAYRDGYLSLSEVVRLGCTVPGNLIGDCGRLEPGFRADLVVLEEDYSLGPVWIGGRRVVGI